MAEEFGEKSHDPTPHRRQQARQRGQVAHSADLTSAGILVSALAALWFIGPSVAGFLTRLMVSSLRADAWQSAAPGTPPSELIVDQWQALVGPLAGAVLPLLGLMLLAAVLLELVQKGFWLLPGRLAPDFSRVDPLAGLRRMTSARNGIRTVFSLVKLAAVALVVAYSLYDRRYELVSAAGLEPRQVAAFVWELGLWTCIKAGATLLVIAALDYAFQRWRFEQDLRMTPQEVREEMRTLQGDPQLVARRRGIGRQHVIDRAARAASAAQVIITGPRDLAVALRYDVTAGGAPLLVAKGTGAVAARIRELARQNLVPMVERPSLAGVLQRQVALDAAIPAPLYASVAEVLAYAREVDPRTAAVSGSLPADSAA
jgi:flagellar biosynthesis protein FlhB